jgi:hypothetical protein
LEHFDNVAEPEEYAGLHQWNLAVENGRFVISRRVGLRTERHDIADELQHLVELHEVLPAQTPDVYHFVV